jgi:hypothetical protein
MLLEESVYLNPLNTVMYLKTNFYVKSCSKKKLSL